VSDDELFDPELDAQLGRIFAERAELVGMLHEIDPGFVALGKTDDHLRRLVLADLGVDVTGRCADYVRGTLDAIRDRAR